MDALQSNSMQSMLMARAMRLNQPQPGPQQQVQALLGQNNQAVRLQPMNALVSSAISTPSAIPSAGLFIQPQNALLQQFIFPGAQKLYGTPTFVPVPGMFDVNLQNILLANAALNNQLLLNATNFTNLQLPSATSSEAAPQSRKRESHHSKKESSKRAKTRSDSEEEEDSTTEYASVNSGDDAEHKRTHHDPEQMHGERRLTIQFEAYGTRGAFPQTFGRGSCVIPDGLCGRHTLYGESWWFSLKHESYDKESGLACVTWTMKSLASDQTYSRTETLAEARKRALHGRTIANQVVKKALEMRAQELEARLATEQNDTWRMHLKGKIESLKPTRFTQGPLVFALHHKAVQDRMKELAVNGK